MREFEYRPEPWSTYVKFGGAAAREDQAPTVHTFDLIVTYKDGSEKTDTILTGFRKKKNLRRYAEKRAESRKNGSESDQIEDVTYKIRNVYIRDWR
jgi:hypothetical protein